MNEITIEEFVKTYNKDEFKSINFDWNGLYGDDFFDENAIFRNHVIDTVIHNPADASLELIRDLYLEEAKWTRECERIIPQYPLLGKLLLLHGGMDCLDVFAEGFLASFDTAMAMHTMKISSELVDAVLEEVNKRLDQEVDEEHLWKMTRVKELFEKFQRGDASEGLFYFLS